MGLNPSAANGLVACTDDQFSKGSREPVACPAASRIGTVEVDTPPLPDGSLSGPVYVGNQLGRNPASGNLYRIFVVAESGRYDISARLLGKASVDPQTGQLTTTFDDGALGKVPLPGLPQVPFRSFRIKFNGGPKAVLTSPPTCGPNTTATQMTPWSSAPGMVPVGAPGGPSANATGPPPPASRSAPPPVAAAARKPWPSDRLRSALVRGTNSAKAATFSPLRMDIARADGNQELKGVDVTLPPGLGGETGWGQILPRRRPWRLPPPTAAPPRPPPRAVPPLAGSAAPTIRAGSGPSPIGISGKVFLAGRYKGAPLSLAVVTPATAGPFDLGTVVVRVALLVEPRTAQVHAVSDPIPHVYGGATARHPLGCRRPQPQ